MPKEPKPFNHYRDNKGRLWLIVSMFGMHEHNDETDNVTLHLIRNYKEGEKPQIQILKIESLKEYIAKNLFIHVIPVADKCMIV